MFGQNRSEYQHITHTYLSCVIIKKFPVIHRYIKCSLFAKESPFIILWFVLQKQTDTIRFYLIFIYKSKYAVKFYVNLHSFSMYDK